MSSSLPIINKTYEAYKRIIELNDGLPKARRYGLGVSLEKSVLEILENLILAKKAPKPLKITYLLKADSQMEIATLKLRLFIELKLSDETKVFQLQVILKEVGKMLGGWLKSAQSQ